jgi:hypothetical protein
MRDFLSQDDINALKQTILRPETNLFHPVMTGLNKSVIGIRSVLSLRDETNPNAYTFIIDAEPESVDITFEIADSDKNMTDIIITQNNDRFSSEKTVSFPTDKLMDDSTFHELSDIVRKQYKSLAMRTILQNATVPYMSSSVKETKDTYHGTTRFNYTLWAPDKEPVRFVMSEALLDLPAYGGNLQYQEFNAFKKQWETKAFYISEALMSTKERVEGNETIVNVPTIYGDDWSITDFIKKQTSQRTFEQDFIADQLYSILNSKVPIEDVNRNYNIAYKVPNISENRISDVDVYIYPADETITEPTAHTKHFILRYQHATEEESGYFKAYDSTTPEPKLIARVPHTPDSIDDMVQLTNHLKELSGPMIHKQIEQKKQLSRFSLNHDVAHEENENLEP